MDPRTGSGPNLTFAFQPIVDVIKREVFSYEALLRGPRNESAYLILKQVSADRLNLFDDEARVGAIVLATRLGIACHLNLNCLPQSLHSSEASIRTTLAAATENHLPIERIVLEVTEGEVILDQAHFADFISQYRGLGLEVAIDDFGAGHSGLNLLANFQPDQIKLNMTLMRGIESHGPRQAIVRALGQVCHELGIAVIAEGVETMEEYKWLANAGMRLFQGYLFAQPEFEAFPPVRYP